MPIDTAVNYEKDAYVPSNADSASVAAQVEASTGVFFGGGDQMPVPASPEPGRNSTAWA